MKISNNWLKDYIKTDLKSEKIGEYLTDIGLEVEGIEKFESITGSLEGIVVGKILTCEKHPNADKLSKTTVEVGNGKILEIVCGATNVEAGQTVPVAVVGTKIYAKDGSFFEIKEAKTTYSEEEMHSLMDEYQDYLFSSNNALPTFKEWFEKYKKVK